MFRSRRVSFLPIIDLELLTSVFLCATFVPLW